MKLSSMLKGILSEQKTDEDKTEDKNTLVENKKERPKTHDKMSLIEEIESILRPSKLEEGETTIEVDKIAEFKAARIQKAKDDILKLEGMSEEEWKALFDQENV